MKEKRLDNACLLDFHYCQGGIGISLERIREKELQGDKPSRPWLMDAYSGNRPAEFYYSLELAQEMAEILRKLGRTNVKSLLSVALNSPAGLELELQRINAHREMPVDFTLGISLCALILREMPVDFTLGGKLDNEQKRKLLYDMVLVYDLWFRGDEKEEGM